MFPKKNLNDILRRRIPSVYGNIDQTFYALRRDSPVTKPDLWKAKTSVENRMEEPIIGREDHVYFVINTAVGVGGKGIDKAPN